MTIAECQVETMKHIEKVREIIRVFTDKLTARGTEHDRLKMESPEVEIFTEYTPKLAETTYGSEEYMKHLEEMNGALQLAKGINDMNLVDIVEMFCDWKASSQRHIDGNILKSIETNASRFNISPQLRQIFVNTAKMFDEQH